MLKQAWSKCIGAPVSPVGPVRILVVDDELPVCEFVDRVLRAAGYATEVVSSSRVALAKAGECGPFDLLLTDVNMPELRGHELASQVRQLDPTIKVLYFTGYSDLLFTEKGQLWEGEAFVEKPVSPEALVEAVALLLAGRVSGDLGPFLVHDPPSPTRRPTILIVDDDPNVASTFSRMLRLEGYDVLTALDGKAGLAECAAGRPDAVLLDLRMPRADGLAFMRALRKREPQRHTPVAVITGDYFIDDAVTRELRDLEAPVYFKPIWFDDLMGIMQHLLRQSH